MLGQDKAKQSVEDARKRLKFSRRVVFFGGAGVSTASGIPDFRSATGLYNQMTGSRYNPETMLSHAFFVRHPDEFYAFLRTSLFYPDAKPNAAHYVLADMEQRGKLDGVITQNIDDLHQQAGSKVVHELHGSLKRFYCTRCYRAYPAEHVYSLETTPHCEACNGLVRPDVVLYGEPLDEDVLNASIAAIRKADCLIVGGSSLVVYPAAGLLDYFRGDCLILINRDPTPYDHQASFVFHGDVGEVLTEISRTD
jgi:NAD-dependent deacetylase